MSTIKCLTAILEKISHNHGAPVTKSNYYRSELKTKQIVRIINNPTAFKTTYVVHSTICCCYLVDLRSILRIDMHGKCLLLAFKIRHHHHLGCPLGIVYHREVQKVRAKISIIMDLDRVFFRKYTFRLGI